MTEHIRCEDGDNEAWVCLCGNRPDLTGFYPCDDKGQYIEPLIGSGWVNLYKCDSCGRVVNQDTLEVIKQVGK